MPNPQRVLIVEDEALVGMALEDALQFLGIDVARRGRNRGRGSGPCRK